MKNLKPVPLRIATGVMGKYARLVSSAALASLSARLKPMPRTVRVRYVK